MDLSNAAVKLDDDLVEALVDAPHEDAVVPALLRGTARGLELVVNARATIDRIIAALLKPLDEAPSFFRGSDLRIRVEDGPLASGCLARIDEIAARFELTIVEVTAVRTDDAIPRPNLAAGSAPAPAKPASQWDDEGPTHMAAAALADTAVAEPAIDATLVEPLRGAPPAMLGAADIGDLTELVAVAPDAFGEEPTHMAAPIQLAPTAEIELETLTNGTRLVVGPVRSGVILEHNGHVIVFGDVNPGAEVRAQGNIVVLGRLRGTAHAAIGSDLGFIMSLRLEPQQLRIGRMVARAADSDTPSAAAEIAYATGDRIVVEQYLGKLPRNLATSI